MPDRPSLIEVSLARAAARGGTVTPPPPELVDEVYAVRGSAAEGEVLTYVDGRPEWRPATGGGGPSGGLALVGVGAPAVELATIDGLLYFERNAAGSTVAEWVSDAGAWVKTLAPLPFASASTLNPALPVPINTYVPIPWDDVAEDASGMLSGANPTRVTIPRTGIYDLWATWGYSVNGTSTRHYIIAKNGDTANGFLFYKIRNDVSATGNIRDVAERKGIRLQAGDYVEFIARQAAGALTLERMPGISPQMSVRMVAP